MQDGLQVTSGIIIRKNRGTHRRAIEAAVLVDHLAAKSTANLLQSWLLRQDKLPSNHVGIDDRDAKVGEHIRNRRLAAGDAASQAYP